MIVAKWKPDFVGMFNGADAQKCADEIQSLGEENITPKNVLEIAKETNSELHKCFEWNNDIAAEKYRISQARTVLTSLVFEVKESEQEDVKPIRAFYKIEDKGYVPTEVIVRQEDTYQQLLKQAQAELRAFKNKYSMLKELQNIFDLIN